MSQTIEFIPVDNLLLDIDNPRLPEDVEKNQAAMLDYIARQTSIEELMEAIGENGFLILRRSLYTTTPVMPQSSIE